MVEAILMRVGNTTRKATIEAITIPNRPPPYMWWLQVQDGPKARDRALRG